MAGLKGQSGPPGNMNAFKHGLAATKVKSFGFEITIEANTHLPRVGMWPGTESNCRHEDFQSSYCNGDYVAVLVYYRRIYSSV